MMGSSDHLVEKYDYCSAWVSAFRSPQPLSLRFQPLALPGFRHRHILQLVRQAHLGMHARLEFLQRVQKPFRVAEREPHSEAHNRLAVLAHIAVFVRPARGAQPVDIPCPADGAPARRAPRAAPRPRGRDARGEDVDDAGERDHEERVGEQPALHRQRPLVRAEQHVVVRVVVDAHLLACWAGLREPREGLRFFVEGRGVHCACLGELGVDAVVLGGLGGWRLWWCHDVDQSRRCQVGVETAQQRPPALFICGQIIALKVR
ncbi:hypothetical protein CALCODRAFT_184051 [Calocera cornea HHB12733]|uniref:Uncharacterized protein n=1 Tax=Calocera cornea HHB12733 TaxID=1353952 RepID=A0A165CAH9_9BASI|nr:hypothetical protein CALCODRAFT_184051 [Calocera cornea HHB12733]